MTAYIILVSVGWVCVASLFGLYWYAVGWPRWVLWIIKGIKFAWWFIKPIKNREVRGFRG